MTTGTFANRALAGVSGVLVLAAAYHPATHVAQKPENVR